MRFSDPIFLFVFICLFYFIFYRGEEIKNAWTVAPRVVG